MLARTTIHDTRELFVHRLGAALTMEVAVEELLGELVEQADDVELRRRLRRHREETHAHIRNLVHAFSALGKEPERQPCPVVIGIIKNQWALLGTSDDSLRDHVILTGVAATEHHEIAVYESLIATAGAMGQEDVVALLAENLDQETHMLGEVLRATGELSRPRLAGPH